MNLKATLEKYFEHYPEDRERLQLLTEQVANDEILNDPTHLPGHCTGAAIVLSPDMQKVLLVHHNFLDRWLQPGGHWEASDPDLLAAARREAEEETRVSIDRYIPRDIVHPLVPVHIDTHYIPANAKKGMPEHFHHDFRYTFVAASEELQLDTDEVKDCRWIPFDELETSDIAKTLRRVRELAAS